MKRTLLALAFFFCIVALPINAADWIYVGESENGESFVDKSSIQRDGDSMTFWIRFNYKKRSPSGTLSNKLQVTINCRTRESILRYIMTYDDIDNRGRLNDQFAPKVKWNPIDPEGPDWGLMMFVCRK